MAIYQAKNDNNSHIFKQGFLCKNINISVRQLNSYLFIILIMGMFIDSYGVLLIGIPLFTPIVYSLGYDPIWFAIIFVVMIQISYLSPPFAYACFYVKGVSKTPIPIGRLYKAVLPFLVLQIICVVLLCLFPVIITWLPGKLM